MGSSDMDPPCTGLGDLFFSDDHQDQAAAKALCKDCPYQVRCLASAIARNETSGVWGGLDARERGYYKRLYGLPSLHVNELPERLRTQAAQ